jgi:hypothetical protein
MRFWKRKKQQVEQADDVVVTATDLAEKTMVIGPTGVLPLLGAAAVRVRRRLITSPRKCAAASNEAASSKSDKRTLARSRPAP